MEDQIQSLAKLFGPFLLAFFVVKGLINTSYETKQESEKLAKMLEFIAGILLPLIVLIAVRREKITTDLWQTFIIGFFIPIAVYFVVFAINKIRLFKRVFSYEGKINQLLLSSFGGGNRGMLLVLTAFGFGSTIGTGVIKHFVVLDIGNLICLLTIGFWLTGSLFKKKPFQLTERIENIIKNPGTYAVLIIFAQLPAFQEYGIDKILTNFDGLLNATAPFLSAFFSFLIFLSIFIRINRFSEVAKNSRDVLLSFLSSRIMVALVFVAILKAFEVKVELLIAVCILLFMPPSSFLWAYISMVAPDIHSLSKRKEVYLIPNFFYFFLLLVAFLLAFLEIGIQ